MAKKSNRKKYIDLSTIDDSGIEFATFEDENAKNSMGDNFDNNICLDDKTDVISSLPEKFTSQNTTPISEKSLNHTLQILDDCIVDYKGDFSKENISVAPVVNNCSNIDIDLDFDISAYVNYEQTLGQELINDTQKFFAPNGILMSASFNDGRPSEDRPQQRTMALAIAQAISDGRNLCVEAPTGVGKSFAYLIPLIYRAVNAGRPALVSTETINLQEQIIEKDLPFLKTITGINFRAALAKGRRNYVCKRRLFMQASDEDKDVYLPIPSLISDVQKVIDTLEKGFDGMRESLSFKVDNNSWNSICCEVGNCAGFQCPYHKECFYLIARKAWEEADIIVANHALFFTDLSCKISTGDAGILPSYGVALIDEAHTLENNAAHHLGIYLTKEDILSELTRLFNPRSGWGLLRRYIQEAGELIDTVISAHDAVELFFKGYETLLFEKEVNSYTFKTPNICPDNLSSILKQVVFYLEGISLSEEDISRRTELDSHINKLKKFIVDIEVFTTQIMPSAVYYAEMSGNKNVSLYAVPLNVSEILKQHLFTEGFPVILCSATLTVQNSFDYYIARTGFMNGETLRLDSPYDSRQAKILLPKRLPDPGDKIFTQALIYYIQRFVSLTKGRAFVLFTSYQVMEFCAQALRPWFEQIGIKLLVQGNDLTRSQMLKEFKQDVTSVLFGTDSFWTGVDVPGEALSNVIITKLPFASPGNPVVEARSELLTSQGKNSFSDYMLPEAILKFRQGVGRLIRSRNDSGIIVILDKRIYVKRYGQAFLGSLPYGFEFVD